MAATLTGNKARLADTLANRNPMINTTAMQQYNPQYNPNQGAGVSGVMGTGNTTGAGGTQTSTYNPIISQASSINDAAKTGGQNLLDGLAGKIGAGTNPAPAPGATDYNAQRNQAYDQYGKSILPDAETKSQIDTAKNDLYKTYDGQTIEQAYNQQRQEKGVADTENRLNQTNQLIRTNQEGARNAQEQNFSSSGGVTDNGVQQLRAYNSRDFIRNLSDLSNVRANTVDELNMKNGQIDTILKLRQQDRAQTQQNLKDKIEMLSNKITPAEKELLMAKLNSKIKSIDTRESAEADRIKKVNEFQMQRDYTLGDINSTDPLKKRVAIENAVNEKLKQYEGLPMVRSSGSMADDIEKLVNGGMSLSDAIKQNIVDPIQAKDEYKDFIAKKMGTQDKYDYKPIQKADANGNLITTGYMAVNKLDPTDYKMLGVDSNGMPSNGGGGSGNSSSSGNVPTNTIDYIKSKEGFRDKAYKDSGGKWTIGYGFTTRADGSPVQPGDTMDQQTADQILQNKVEQYQNFSNKITVPLSDAQKTALTSFEYNLGKNIWDGTAKPIIDKINAGDFAGAAEYMKKFNTVKGTVIGGLTNRRNEEAGLMTQTAPESNNTEKSFTTDKIDTYRNVLNGIYPKEIKDPNQINGKKLLEEATEWNEALKRGDTSALSTNAQRAISNKTVTGSEAQKQDTLNELNKAGLINVGKGNDTFYLSTQAQKSEIPALITAQDRFNEAKEIVDKHTKDGDLDEMLGSWDAYEERKKNNTLASWARNTDFGSDFAKLDQIFGKELSQYMNQISGATVGDKEVERLKRQIPNLDMSETEFKSAFDAYSDSLNNAQDYMLSNYGFKDVDTLRSEIGLKPNIDKYK